MSRTDTDWYVVSEVPAPHLVCHARMTQVDGNGDKIGEHLQEIPGPVSIITEHERVVNDDGTLGGLCDTRTRLVVRAEWDVSGNGSEYGITPTTVDDDRAYTSYLFTARDESPSGRSSVSSGESDHSVKLEDRHDQAIADFVLQDQVSLVRDFVAERLERTGRESDLLSVRMMFREYRNWCYDRSLREDETLPFTGVMKALGTMGFVRTGEPLIMLDQSVWPEYAFTGVKIYEDH